MRASSWTLPFALFTATAFAAQPIIHSDFEDNEAGWIAYGPETAHVRITHDPAEVKNGKSSLELDYVASSTKPAAVVLPVKQSLGNMQSIRLWLMADSPTAAAISLSEKQGGRYLAVVWLEPHAWQRVELVPEDFSLAQNANDPKDPDGKLDLDQIDSIGVIDVSQILNATIDEHSGHVAIVTHTGPRKLFVDDFEVSAERPAWFHAPGKYAIDSFDHPQLNWLTLGGPELKRDTSAKVINGNALQASYHQMEETFVLIVHPLAAADFTGATHLAFDIASDNDAHIMFVLEQQTPPKTRYHCDVEVKGGGKAEHREVALSAFQLDRDGVSDASGKLDLHNLKSLGILDITGAYTEETAANTLRIGNIGMIKTAALPQ